MLELNSVTKVGESRDIEIRARVREKFTVKRTISCRHWSIESLKDLWKDHALRAHIRLYWRPFYRQTSGAN